MAPRLLADEAIRRIEIGIVEEISLDHDLGGDARGTGYDVILWIEDAVALRRFKPPKIIVHSANSSAADKMRAGVLAIEQLAGVAAYYGFRPVAISWNEFRERWIPGLSRDELLAGINRSGPRATGFDILPSDLARNVETLRNAA